MNRKPEIEEMLTAAARRQADLKRQQKLNEMINQLAEEESAANQRRNKAAVWISIAASIMLIATIAIYLSRQNEGVGNQRHLTAQNNTVTTPDSAASNDSNTKTATYTLSETTPTQNAAVASNSTTKHSTGENLQIAETNDPNHGEITTALVAEADNASTGDNTPIQTEETEPSSLMSDNQNHKVFTRNSTKLVSHTKAQDRDIPYANNRKEHTPTFSFVSATGTSTTVDIRTVKL